MPNLPSGYSQRAAEDLLRKYACPVPFHAVRTRFLGNVASPGFEVKPFDEVKALWGGELPEFKDIDELNKLVEMLVMGLWNDLTKHQKRSAPFRLFRPSVAETREGVLVIAKVRSEEIEGFVDGLFGKQPKVELPERGANGLDALAKVGSMFAAMTATYSNPSITGTQRDIATTFKGVRDLTQIAEREIHEVVLACTRARKDFLSVEIMSKMKPTLH